MPTIPKTNKIEMTNKKLEENIPVKNEHRGGGPTTHLILGIRIGAGLQQQPHAVRVVTTINGSSH